MSALTTNVHNKENASKSPYKMKLTPMQQKKIGIQNELVIIFREFSKAQTILNDKKISQVRKVQIDPDKWKKKFKYLFDREKILCFDNQNSSNLFQRKGVITLLEPRPLSQLGQDILMENHHFWVLFTYYNKTKIEFDIDNREKVRRQVVDNLFEDKWHIEDNQKQEILKEWLDNMLYLPDLTTKPKERTPDCNKFIDVEMTSEQQSKLQSTIPQHLREIQQEGEIIDFDDQNWCKKFVFESKDQHEQDVTFRQSLGQAKINESGLYELLPVHAETN